MCHPSTLSQQAKLMGSLEVSSAADVLTLSDQHKLTFLKDAAMRFVASHAKNVMGEKTASPGWAHLKQTRPALIDEARAISLPLSLSLYLPNFATIQLFGLTIIT